MAGEKSPGEVLGEMADRGPLGLAKDAWNTATHGLGPAGLVSSDGTLGTGVKEAGEAALFPMGTPQGYKDWSGGVNAYLSGPPPGQDPASGPDYANAAPGFEDGSMGLQAGFMGENDAADGMFRTVPGGGPAGQQAVNSPEGESYAPVGGKRGKTWFEDTMVEGPKRMESAIQEGQKAVEDKNKAIGQYYDQETSRQHQESTDMQVRRQRDAGEVEARQRNLDSATEYYTNDLNDTGKFWTNPGNIISAIAYSLMPIVAPNDPGIGIRAINDAINRDMASRKNAADTALGALRSNLHGYQQIAGDRQAGDLLAASEARRVAAMDVERISQRFSSQESRVKAQATIEQLRMDSGMMRMQAYQKLKVYQESRMMDPRVMAGRGQGFDGAFEPFSAKAGPTGVGKGVNAGPSGAGNVQGTIGNSPTVANPNGKSMSPQQVALLHNPNAIAGAFAAGRIPGGKDLMDMYQASISQMAAAKTGYRPGMDPKAYNTEILRMREEAQKGKAAVATAVAPEAAKVDGLRRLQGDMKFLQANSKDPNEYLGNISRSLLPGATPQWVENMSRIANSNPTTPEQLREVQKAQSAMRIRSALASQKVEYYHDIAGGSQTDNELAGLKEVISSSSDWGQAMNFVDMRSKGIQATMASKIAMGGYGPAGVLYLAQSGLNAGNGAMPAGKTNSIPKSDTQYGKK